MKKISLIGNKIILEVMKKKDAKAFFENIKDPEISEYSGPYYATSFKKAKKYIKKCEKRIIMKENYCLGIYSKVNQEFLGSIGLINVDYKNKNAEIGSWIGKKFWGRGFMTEATKLIISYGFKELHLHRIYASVHEKNIGSKRVMEKCGFKEEGKTKESVFSNGKYFDEINYSKINDLTL